jgi:hypothetical protein
LGALHELGEHDLQSVGHNLCDNLVHNVTQIDRSKVMDSVRTKLFRYQSNVSVILFLQQNMIQEKILDTTKNLHFHHILVFLIEQGSESIRAKSFGRT